MVGLIIALLIAAVSAILLAGGFEKMQDEHPDYKGEDFLNWNEDENSSNR